MGTTQAKNIMHELRLVGMLEQYDNLIHSATASGLGCGEFLDLILQSEYDWRKKKRVESRIKSSKLPRKKTFEDFDYTAERTVTKAQIKELMSLRWLEQGRPVLLVGQTGVGKSFIAEACAMQACRTGKVSLWIDISALLEELALSKTTGSYVKLREKLSRPDVLVIDDFGMRKLNSTEAQDLCEILETRSYGKSTIITTQLPLSHWVEVIGDPVIADAIIDRLKHSAVELKIKGKTYREHMAQKLDAGGVKN
jgi:DNA replication protein DnaC